MTYNPKQPRDPKGLTTGGRWAAIGSSGGTYTVKAADHETQKKAGMFFSTSFLENPTPAQKSVEFLYSEAVFMLEGLNLVQDEKGIPRAFFAGGVVPYSGGAEVYLGTSPYYLRHLGAAVSDIGSGWGARAFVEAIREGLAGNATGMAWGSESEQSAIFYHAIGAHMYQKDYYLYRKEMEAILEAYDSSKR
jgi:hypothetical protein